MFNTARLSDLCTHGAKIIEGSSKRFANGLPVARLGDKVLCPLHAIPDNKIIEVTGGMPYTDGLLTAHGTAKAKCGAMILINMETDGGSAALDQIDMATEDMTPEEKRAYIAGKFGGGAGGAAIADGMMRADGASSSENVPYDDPNAKSSMVNCGPYGPQTPYSTKISKYFTVGQLVKTYQFTEDIGQGNKGLSRGQIICNLKHLAVNSLDRCVDWLNTNGYTMRIGSGFRGDQNGSDHNIGSAADMHIFRNGQRVLDIGTLTQLSKAMIASGIPFTQVLAETKRSRPSAWIHWANRSNGVKSRAPFLVMYV